MRKILCICLILMTFLVTSFSSHANTSKETILSKDIISKTPHNSIYFYKEFKVRPNNKITTQYVKPLSTIEIENMFVQFEHKFNKNSNNFTKQKQSASFNILKQVGYNKINSITKSSSDYDENKKKLRQANFIEGILDVDENLSESDITIILINSSIARKFANKTYPNDSMLADALRHFSWNNNCVKDVGTTKTRTATINHEWGIIMLQPMLNYYENRYQKYVSDGSNNPANKALADVVSYIPMCKEYTIAVCKDETNGYAAFKALFSASCIMDLHNNCYGRAYASTNSDLTAKEAFDIAKKNNELILSESNVGDAQYDYVYRSEWYTY